MQSLQERGLPRPSQPPGDLPALSVGGAIPVISALVPILLHELCLLPKGRSATLPSRSFGSVRYFVGENKVTMAWQRQHSDAGQRSYFPSVSSSF